MFTTFFFQTMSIIWPLLSLWVAFNIKSSSVYRGNARHYYYFSLIWPPGYIYVRPNDSPTPTPSSSELGCDLRFHLIKDLGSSTVKSYPNPFLFFFYFKKCSHAWEGREIALCRSARFAPFDLCKNPQAFHCPFSFLVMNLQQGVFLDGSPAPLFVILVLSTLRRGGGGEGSFGFNF